jgi:Fe-Mn family superoxide dismutase
MGKAQAAAQGWVILAYSPRDKRSSTNGLRIIGRHLRVPAGARSRHVRARLSLDYGAAAARYVDVFMEAIHWTTQ